MEPFFIGLFWLSTLQRENNTFVVQNVKNCCVQFVLVDLLNEFQSIGRCFWFSQMFIWNISDARVCLKHCFMNYDCCYNILIFSRVFYCYFVSVFFFFSWNHTLEISVYEFTSHTRIINKLIFVVLSVRTCYFNITINKWNMLFYLLLSCFYLNKQNIWIRNGRICDFINSVPNLNYHN